MFEDSMVEKEIDIRKRVLKDYNKKEEDFATLREYNDYLEEIETIVYNLTNNIDIVGTNKRIEQYKKDNKEIIMKNKAKIGNIIQFLAYIVYCHHHSGLCNPIKCNKRLYYEHSVVLLFMRLSVLSNELMFGDYGLSNCKIF